MKKRIITGLVALTSMVSSAAAQDIYRTAANVPDGTTQQWNTDASIRPGDILPAVGLGVRAVLPHGVEGRLPSHRHRTRLQ
jgi:hypothetical protein